MFAIFAVRARKTYQFKCTIPYAMDQEVKNSISQNADYHLWKAVKNSHLLRVD